MTEAETLAALAAPFPPERVSWRVGATTSDKKRGMALAYIDARDVLDRLNAVLGVHWQCRYVPHHNGTTCCEIGVLIGAGWLWRANGAGATDHEAEKGAYSDAFKRAAVMWGVGRYLYDLDSPWVQIEPRGKSFAIPDTELAALAALLRGEKPKSARQGHSDGHFRRLERAIRECETIKALAVLWKHEQENIATLPAGWRSALTDEKDRRKEQLLERAVA